MANQCMNEEALKCTNKHIVQDIIPAALKIERMAQLLRMAASPEHAAWKTKANQQVAACHVYLLELDSTASVDLNALSGSESVAAMVMVRGNAPLLDDPLAWKLTGADVLHSTTYSVTSKDPCNAIPAMAPADSTLSVNSLGLKVNKDGSIKDFPLRHFPSTNHSIFWQQAQCSQPLPPPVALEAVQWMGLFGILVVTDPTLFNTTDGFVLSNW